jgi:hypothetical protein
VEDSLFLQAADLGLGGLGVGVLGG